ncbi:DUF5133 domain-containing protein [Streptomyces piniterrae]|uniref:DUF5133 domain-containing protein n=1 Tax=Streptomyces piniterrae TaxID=2571125 RepID=A0A4U0MU16_9ACTN|nr:DUF5133 domain-containing protein [Streptomyces piniterrae]TJZ44042.1 DUF5133 domain-containing protein [Streptomyces piniterrae]
MLLPDRNELAALLRRYRVWEHLVLTKPHDQARRRGLEDIAYTLCVLMGRRTVREAVIAAEVYLESSEASACPPAERAGEG